MGSLRVRNAVAGGLGTPYARACNIPQGSPFSMKKVAFLFRPWVLRARALNVIPRGLADDLSVWAEGPHHVYRVQLGFAMTIFYVADIGGRISPSKSFTTSSSEAGRRWLRDHVWPCVRARIPVRLHFRDLGAHFTMRRGIMNPTLRNRICNVIPMCSKLSSGDFLFHDKIANIRCNILPKALYGCEVSPFPVQPITSLQSAVIKPPFSPSRTRCPSVAYSIADKNNVDPYSLSIFKRFIILRRVFARRPALLQRVHEMLVALRDQGAPVLRHDAPQADCLAALPDPAPPHGHQRRLCWNLRLRARGPVASLLQEAYYNGALLDDHARLHAPHLPPLDFVTHELRATKCHLWHWLSHMRIRAVVNLRPLTSGLHDLDVEAFHAAARHRSPSNRGTLRHIASGGARAASVLFHAGIVDDTACAWCGAGKQDAEHILWHCTHPALVHARRGAHADLVDSLHLLPAPLRFGLPPRMAADPSCTFWGQRIDAAPLPVREQLGAADSMVMQRSLRPEALDLLRELAALHTGGGIEETAPAFARNIVHLLLADPFQVSPSPPGPQTGPPPPIPNLFSDGSLSFPQQAEWAMGGGGIWYESPIDLPPELSPLFFEGQAGGGLARHFPIGRPCGSSYRTELVALCMAMYHIGPIFVALDNEAVVNRANFLLLLAQQAAAQLLQFPGLPLPRRLLYLLGKPWTLLCDGDFGDLFYRDPIARNPATIAIKWMSC